LSQLHALLQTLSDEECTLLHSIRLIGKEKEVFNFLLQHRSTELPDSDNILKSLDITDTHYYKINSVLLRKCYQCLVPGEGAALLQFLKLKNLFSLLRHEILTQDKKRSSSKDTDADKEFYLSCFHYFIDFPYKYYDKKLTDAFGEKYLKACGHEESDKLYVKYHKLLADVNRMSARKNPKKALGVSIQELHKQEEALAKSQHYLATYYLYRAISSYYNYYEKNNEKVLEYLQKAIGLKDKIAYFFKIDIGKFLELLYADTLFQNNKVAEAESIYSKAFKGGMPDNMFGYFYHCEQYALVLITTKEYDKALELLNRVFLPCIENKLDIYATRGAMCYVKLYLSNGELKNASHYLNIAKGINEKTFYLPFDVQLRVLENIYFFLKDDFEFALQLANRNIKFLRAQEQEEVFSDYLRFWKMITVFLNSIFKESEIPASALADLEYLNQHYRNLYCNLFPMLLERTRSRIA
jgi:hypothetical protein